MKIKVLGCYGGELPGNYLTGFLLDEDTLIDAGTIALNLDIEGQRKVRNILISHAHLDHICSIPFFGVNIVSNESETLKIIGSKFSLEAIANHIMNGVVWPDFTKIKNAAGNPIFGYVPVSMSKWYTFGKYKIKAIPVKHTVPTNGYIIGKGDSYIMYSGDTKETDAIWAEAKKLGKKLKAVMVETSFPNKMSGLADLSCHLVPSTLASQLEKLGDSAKPKVFLYHIKPEYMGEVKKEIKQIKGFEVTAMEQGKTYKI